MFIMNNLKQRKGQMSVAIHEYVVGIQESKCDKETQGSNDLFLLYMALR